MGLGLNGKGVRKNIDSVQAHQQNVPHLFLPVTHKSNRLTLSHSYFHYLFLPKIISKCANRFNLKITSPDLTNIVKMKDLINYCTGDLKYRADSNSLNVFNSESDPIRKMLEKQSTFTNLHFELINKWGKVEGEEEVGEVVDEDEI